MKAKDIVSSQMYDRDAFSQWLGIDLIEVISGSCTVRMTVRSEMLNGFAIAHGGITYALADSAFAFAINSTGRQAVSLETSISHTAKVLAGDILTATTDLVSASRKFAIYHVMVKNQRDELVATFKGTGFYTGKDWE